MFSRLTSKLVVKNAINTSMLVKVSQRGFLRDLGLESHALQPVKGDKEADAIEFWREHHDDSKALTLKNDDEISKYVLQISRDYFRTTKKAKLSLDSTYRDHGLDSLDVIELVIQVEDDLGYVIDAENLEKFQKPKHFVNYIKQIESYKKEFGKLPHNDKKASFNLKEAFPTKSKKEEHHH